jgi:hypothetical protein
MASVTDDPLARLQAVQAQLQGLGATQDPLQFTDAETARNMLAAYDSIITSAQGLLKSQLTLVQQFLLRPNQDTPTLERLNAMEQSFADQVEGLEALRTFLLSGDGGTLAHARQLMQRGADAAQKLRKP